MIPAHHKFGNSSSFLCYLHFNSRFRPSLSWPPKLLETLPGASEALPSAIEALPAALEALSADSEAHTAASEALKDD